MADTAAFLVDRVLPIAAVRQWVLSLPFGLRYRLAYDSNVMVLRISARPGVGGHGQRLPTQLENPA